MSRRVTLWLALYLIYNAGLLVALAHWLLPNNPALPKKINLPDPDDLDAHLGEPYYVPPIEGWLRSVPAGWCRG